MKIGIRFSDNDFYFTVGAFMRQLVEASSNLPQAQAESLVKELTKKRIVELFNGMAPSLYILHQDQFRYSAADMIPNYLTITTKDVLLGKQVDTHLKKCDGWDNGEFQYVNLAGDKVIYCI